MTDQDQAFLSASAPKEKKSSPTQPTKGPLNYLSGAITSGLLAWLALGLSQRVVRYFMLHPPQYSSRIATNIAVAFKTLLIGLSFLATFTCAFVGIGLTLLFVQSLFNGNQHEST